MSHSSKKPTKISEVSSDFRRSSKNSRTSKVPADAAGPDALQKLARYERTLMNNHQTALRELKELQDGRVEQAANSV